MSIISMYITTPKRSIAKLTVALVLCMLTIFIMWLCGYNLFDWRGYALIIIAVEAALYFGEKPITRIWNQISKRNKS